MLSLEIVGTADVRTQS